MGIFRLNVQHGSTDKVVTNFALVKCFCTEQFHASAFIERIETVAFCVIPSRDVTNAKANIRRRAGWLFSMQFAFTVCKKGKSAIFTNKHVYIETGYFFFILFTHRRLYINLILLEIQNRIFLYAYYQNLDYCWSKLIFEVQKFLFSRMSNTYSSIVSHHFPLLHTGREEPFAESSIHSISTYLNISQFSAQA